MERVKVIQNLRQGLLPDTFVKLFPKESMLVLWMTTMEDPKKRPTIEEIMEFGLGKENDTILSENKSYDGLDGALDIEMCECSCCKKWIKRTTELEAIIAELRASK